MFDFLARNCELYLGMCYLKKFWFQEISIELLILYFSHQFELEFFSCKEKFHQIYFSSMLLIGSLWKGEELFEMCLEF